MGDEKKSEEKEKSSYGEKMRKKLETEREQNQAHPTKKRAKKAKKMRK
jgi:hypothetical protein